MHYRFQEMLYGHVYIDDAALLNRKRLIKSRGKGKRLSWNCLLRIYVEGRISAL